MYTSQIKLTLLPAMMQQYLDDKKITVNQLTDEKKLSSILSGVVVDKLAYLNTPPNAKNKLNQRVLDVTSLGLIHSLCSNELFKNNATTFNVPNLLSSLCRLGEEVMQEDVSKELHNYTYRFESLRVDSKMYVVLLSGLVEVSGPQQRLEFLVNDMEKLLSLMKLELTDAQLLDNNIYNSYLSLFN